MSKITELMTKRFMSYSGWTDVEQVSERRDREYTSVLDAMQAAVEALCDAGYQIVQKPLELTPAMALRSLPATWLHSEEKIRAMRDGVDG